MMWRLRSWLRSGALVSRVAFFAIAPLLNNGDSEDYASCIRAQEFVHGGEPRSQVFFLFGILSRFFSRALSSSVLLTPSRAPFLLLVLFRSRSVSPSLSPSLSFLCVTPYFKPSGVRVYKMTAWTTALPLLMATVSSRSRFLFTSDPPL